MATMMDEELLDMMRQEEDALLAATLPAIRAPEQVAAPIPISVSSGRMYMGPQFSSPQAEQAFMESPYRQSLNLMPPPTPEAAAGAGARVAEMTRPVVTGGPYDPEMERFAALQQIESAIARGMPANEARALYGRGLFQAAGGGRRYNVSGVGLVDESGNVIARAPQRPTRPIAVAGVGLVDPDTGRVLVAPPQTETETEVIPGEPGIPEIPATPGEQRSLFGIDILRRDIPPSPAIPGTPGTSAKRITRKVVVGRPTGSKGKLNKGQAASFLKQAGGDKNRARQLAVEAGYEL